MLGNTARHLCVGNHLVCNRDVLATDVVLVGALHVLVKDLHGDGDEGGVSDPSAVVAGSDLAELVGADLGHGLLVALWVVLERDLGRHTAHGGDLALVAGLDEETNIGVHEGNGHGDVGTVWEDCGAGSTLALDEGEDVVPTATVQSCRVLLELEEDLLHLVCGGESLDEDGGADDTVGEAAVGSGEVEDVVPETGLEVVLHLGEVEVWAKAALDELVGVVEEVETKVKERTRHGLAVNDDTGLLEVPSTRTDKENSGVLGKLVLLAVELKVDFATDGVVKVDLAENHVGPGGRVRVLKVGHEGLGARVQCVDDHLAVGRAGNLNATVLETRAGGSTLP